MAAWVPLMRPPFFRYSSVSRATYMTMSFERSSRTSAISAAEWPSFARSTPIRARMPSAIEAPSESTTWISRSGSMSRAIWALLIVPESVPATWTETIASAPAAKAPSYASLNSPGDEAAVFGHGASGATMRSQNASVESSVPALKVSSPKLTRSGMTEIPRAAASLGSRSDAESVKIATRLKVGSSCGR